MRQLSALMPEMKKFQAKLTSIRFRSQFQETPTELEIVR